MSSRAARDAVALAFVVNGFAFASLFARVPDLRSGLGLGNAELGLLLLAGSAGSVLALPSAGALVRRTSPAAVVRAGAVLVALGLMGVGWSVAMANSVLLTAVALFAYGAGSGVWDVAMNVEGAAVERLLRRTVLPRFHAGWSLGSVAGAGTAVIGTALDLDIWTHLAMVALLVLAATLPGTRGFLPSPDRTGRGPQARARSAWLEPRTLGVGLLVLVFALTEGAANDWLALALIDGYDAPRWLGVAGFALFVTAMTTGRLVGGSLADRWGRVRVLQVTGCIALLGVVLLVGLREPWAAPAAIVLWGLGASLGFPLGVSAAADDPARSPARVSVVSTLGYAAFLAGPPALGLLGEAVGTLPALWVVAGLLVVTLTPLARVVSSGDEPSRDRP